MAPVMLVKALEFDILARQREGIVLELLSRLGESVLPGQQPCEGVFEIPQGVLQGVDRGKVEPVSLGALQRKLSRLPVIAKTEPVILVLEDATLQGAVVFPAASADPLPHRVSLIRRRLSAILVGAPDQHLRRNPRIR
jgi:hypothetical protein